MNHGSHLTYLLFPCPPARVRDNHFHPASCHCLHPPAVTMRHHYLLVSLAVLLASTAASAVEPSDLRPGLIATFRDSGSTEITRLEPTVALWLAGGEAPHPRLGGLTSARWKGYVNITRPGKHVFSANIQGGTIRVSVGGKLVLSGMGAPNEVEIEGGVQTFEAVFTSTSTPARVELLWRGPGFVNEPLNNRFLGHLPADRPKAFLTDLEQEHGRFLFEELACAKCHKASANDRMAQSLAERTGPNLTDISKRAYPGWIDAWLADPARLRPHTTMPKLFADSEVGRAERYAITKFLVSLSDQSVERYRPPFNASNELRQSVERGRVLYSVAGLRCMSPADFAQGEERGGGSRATKARGLPLFTRHVGSIGEIPFRWRWAARRVPNCWRPIFRIPSRPIWPGECRTWS